jgi:hypothetical protein
MHGEKDSILRPCNLPADIPVAWSLSRWYIVEETVRTKSNLKRISLFAR